ncbi:MAG: hypothetical protein U1E05_05980, partial [Patescibacteria group bacterium]|nr:hypothetical protein [Patescibacteria group bacterium]
MPKPMTCVDRPAGGMQAAGVAAERLTIDRTVGGEVSLRMAIHENSMVPPPNFDDLNGQLAELCQLVRERAPAEADIVVGFDEARDRVQKTRTKTLESITERYESDSSVAEAAYAKARRQVIEQFDAESRKTEKGCQSARQEAVASAKSEEAALRESAREKHFEAYTVAEAVKNAATIELREANARIVAQVQQAAAVRKHAELVLRRYRQWPAVPDTAPSAELATVRTEPSAGTGATNAAPRDIAPDRQLGERLQDAQQQYQRLAALSLPQLFQGARPVGLFVLVFLALVVPTALLAGPSRWQWIAAAIAAAGVTFGVGLTWLHRVAGRTCEAAHAPLRRLLAEIDALAPAARAAVQARYEHTVTTITAKQAEQVAAADAALRQTLARHHREREGALAELDSAHSERMSQLAVARDGSLEAAEAHYSERMAEIHRNYRDASERTEREHAVAMLDLDQRHQRQWSELTDRW